MKRPGFLPVFGAALFFLLLAFRRLGPLDFWWWMSANVVLLISLGLAADPSYRGVLLDELRKELLSKVVLGAVSALALYGFFWLGLYLSRLFLPGAQGKIEAIYAFREDASPLRIALLMAFLIGPGEELWWRGFVQRRWMDRRRPSVGWVMASALYAFVHIGSGNLILVGAALVCGLYWGGLYLRYRSLLLIALSHTLWDILIFVIRPLH